MQAKHLGIKRRAQSKYLNFAHGIKRFLEYEIDKCSKIPTGLLHFSSA